MWFLPYRSRISPLGNLPIADKKSNELLKAVKSPMKPPGRNSKSDCGWRPGSSVVWGTLKSEGAETWGESLGMVLAFGVLNESLKLERGCFEMGTLE